MFAPQSLLQFLSLLVVQSTIREAKGGGALQPGIFRPFGEQTSTAGLLRAPRDPLAQWLHSAKIPLIANETVTVEVLGVNVTLRIQSLECTNLSLGLLSATGTPPGESIPRLDLGISGITAGCNGTWHTNAFQGLDGHLQIQIGTEAFEDSAAKLGLQLKRGLDLLPVEAKLQECTVKLGFPTGWIKITPIPGSGEDREWLYRLLETAANPLRTLIRDEIDRLTCEMLKVVVFANLTAALEHTATRLGRWLPVSTVPPPAPSHHLWPDTADLRNSSFFLGLSGMFNPYWVNAAIHNATNGSGVVATQKLTDAPLELVRKMTNEFEMLLTLHSVELSGMSSWSALSLFAPVGPTLLQTTTNSSALGVTVQLELKITALRGPLMAVPLLEKLNFKLDLSNPAMVGRTQLAVDPLYPNKLVPFECFASKIKNVSTDPTWFSFELNELKFDASSPSGGQLEQGLHHVLNETLSWSLGLYGIETAPAWANAFLGPAIAAAIDEIVGPIGEPCNALSSSTADPTVIQSTATAAVLMTIVVLLSLQYVMEERKPLQYSTTSDNPYIPVINASQPSSPSSVVAICTENESAPLLRSISPVLAATVSPVSSSKPLISEVAEGSLLLSERLHWTTRIGLLTLILANVVLLVSCNTAVGARVFPVIQFGSDRPIKLPALFEFTALSLSRDWWNAGSIPAVGGVLIFIASFCWPFVHSVLLLGCLVLPGRAMPGRLASSAARRRERALQALYCSVRWSLPYMMVLGGLTVVFRLHFAIGDASPPVILLDTFIELDWGFYGLIMAIVAEFLLCAATLHCHRLVCIRALKPNAETRRVQAVVPLAQTPFAINAHSHATPTSSGAGSLTLLLVGALLTNIVGVWGISTNLEFKGLAGRLLPASDVNAPLSIAILAIDLPKKAFYETTGLLVVQVIAFGIALGLPLLRLIAAALLWLIPHPLWRQQYLFKAGELLANASCVDVMMVSLILVMPGVPDFVVYAVREICGQIDDIVGTVAPSFVNSYGSCFEVDVTIYEQANIAMVATVAFAYLGCTTVMQFAYELLQHRWNPGDGVCHADTKGWSWLGRRILGYIPGLARQQTIAG